MKVNDATINAAFDMVCLISELMKSEVDSMPDEVNVDQAYGLAMAFVLIGFSTRMDMRPWELLQHANALVHTGNEVKH